MSPEIPKREQSLAAAKIEPTRSYPPVDAINVFSPFPRTSFDDRNQHFLANIGSAFSTAQSGLGLAFEPEPTDLISVSFALAQAEKAVQLDSDGDLNAALFYYREAILSLHHFLHWEIIFQARNVGVTDSNEREELKLVLARYIARVDEIGQTSEYATRPCSNTMSVWASNVFNNRIRLTNRKYNLKIILFIVGCPVCSKHWQIIKVYSSER